MINLYVQVTGGQVGRDLQGDPEELAEALKELADGFPDDIGENVAEYLDDGEKARVKQLLRNLRDAIGDD
jgi:predicted transcriptional regulator